MHDQNRFKHFHSFSLRDNTSQCQNVVSNESIDSSNPHRPHLRNPNDLTEQPLRKYRGADKSLARPGGKQATATEDFEFHISYL